jgi:hypothetical protein
MQSKEYPYSLSLIPIFRNYTTKEHMNFITDSANYIIQRKIH